MSKTNSLETSILALIFNGTSITGIADNASIGPLTDLYVSLHSADPGEAGAQNTSELAYTGYARVATGRTSSEWQVSGSTACNTIAVTFGQCTASSGVATYFGIGSSSSGVGTLYFSGVLTAALTITAGITPFFASGALTLTED
jgi:hypothetical protein